jgi:hypothetical protein
MTSLISLASQADAQSWVAQGHVQRDYRPLTPSDRGNGMFRVHSTRAEDGTQGQMLWLSPRRTAGGWVEVHFPRVRVPPGAVFRSRIGFPGTAGRSSDGVHYEVAVAYYKGSDRSEVVIRQGHKGYTGSLIPLNLDLSPFVDAADGAQLSIILRVGAGQNSDNDNLLWIDPRIDTGASDPYQFDLHLDHFAANVRNPTIFLRAAWINGDTFNVGALTSARPTVFQPPPMALGNNGSNFPGITHRFTWRSVQAHPKLLGPEDASALCRFALIALYLNRDKADQARRDRAMHISNQMLRLRPRDELLTMVLNATRNLEQRAPRGSFETVARDFRLWCFEAVDQGYGLSLTTGTGADIKVGTAVYEASLLELLLNGRPDGPLVQLHHPASNRGRCALTGRITLARS